MESEQFDIAKLIADYLSGKVDDKDLIRLHEWIGLSESNKEIFEKLSNEQYRMGKSEKRKSFDVEKAWKNLEKQRPELVKKERGENKIFYMRIIKIAAALIIFLGGLYSIYRYSDKQDLKNSDVFEGYEAQLKLSDGRVIDLTKINGEIILDNAANKVKNSNDILVYKNNEKASETSKIEYNEVSVSYGRGYKIVLSDGSAVYMNSLSKLRFPVNFSSERREVYLDGEAYFEVSKDKSRPFIVKAGMLNVQVLGTIFNISSYSDDNLLLTTLVEGSVKVSGNDIKDVILTPGEQLSFNKKENEVSKEIVDVSYFTAWKDGNFRFRDIRLEDLMKIVHRLYNVEVIFSESDIKEYIYGCNISRYEQIDPVLRIIEANGKLVTKMEGRTLIISKK